MPTILIKAIVESNTTREDFIADEIIKRNPTVVGIYRVVVKTDSDIFRAPVIQGIIFRIKAKVIEVVVYEFVLEEGCCFNSRVDNNLKEFKKVSDVIVAKRISDELEDVTAKEYTLDLFGID